MCVIVLLTAAGVSSLNGASRVSLEWLSGEDRGVFRHEALVAGPMDQTPEMTLHTAEEYGGQLPINVAIHNSGNYSCRS